MVVVCFRFMVKRTLNGIILTLLYYCERVCISWNLEAVLCKFLVAFNLCSRPIVWNVSSDESKVKCMLTLSNFIQITWGDIKTWFYYSRQNLVHIRFVLLPVWSFISEKSSNAFNLHGWTPSNSSIRWSFCGCISRSRCAMWSTTADSRMFSFPLVCLYSRRPRRLSARATMNCCWSYKSRTTKH